MFFGETSYPPRSALVGKRKGCAERSDIIQTFAGGNWFRGRDIPDAEYSAKALYALLSPACLYGQPKGIISQRRAGHIPRR